MNMFPNLTRLKKYVFLIIKDHCKMSVIKEDDNEGELFK